MASDKKIQRIGLALGGGASFGAAHIGVLRALEESALEIQCISGTSIGAYVAALYAFGVSTDDIQEEIIGLDWLDITSIALPKLQLGLLSNEKLGASVEKMISKNKFSEARIPLAIVTTDISTCRKHVVTSGSVAKAVMASTCVPGIFSPVEDGDAMLVDGGLVENVPISPLLDMDAEHIVAVDLGQKRTHRTPANIVDVIINSIDAAIDTSTALQTAAADLIIAPELSDYSRVDDAVSAELVEAGYNAAQKDIRNWLNESSRRDA